MMYGFGYMPFGFFGGFLMLIFWALVIWAIVAFIRWTLGAGRGEDIPRSAQPREKAPLEILQERYAKGEITKKEYDQKKTDLI